MSEATYEGKMPTIDDFCDPEPIEQKEMFPGFPYFLFTPTELANAKSREKLLCKCAQCGKEFWKEKHFLQRNIKDNNPILRCSYKCGMLYRSLVKKAKHPKEYTCETCGKIVLWEERYASGRFCCSQCYHKFSSKFANSSEARKKKSNTLKSLYKERNLPKNNSKLIYKNQCKFKMNVNVYTLLSTFTDTDPSNWYGMNHIYDREQTSRDHMVSQEYGYNHKIDPYLISHPANCLLIKQSENSSKREECSLTLGELIDRVEFFNETILEQKLTDIRSIHQYKLNPNLSEAQLKHYLALSLCE